MKKRETNALGFANIQEWNEAFRHRNDTKGSTKATNELKVKLNLASKAIKIGCTPSWTRVMRSKY